MTNINSNIVIEDANIGFRNFSGEESKFNPKGRRNFCVFLDSETGTTLETDGWNIKWLDPRDEEDEPTPFLPVAVSYDNIPPQIILITGQGKTLLDADTVSVLDWAELKMVDVIIRPYNWEVNGKSGVKAYIKSMYVTIVEDELAHKYYEVPDVSDGSED